MLISLTDVAQTNNLIGSDLGRAVHQAMYDLISVQPMDKMIAIVPGNAACIDATFAREALVTLGKRLQGSSLVYLKNFENRDFLDNFSYAARALDFHLMHLSGTELQVIGAQLSKSSGAVLEAAFGEGLTTTSAVANAVGMSVQNVSTTMKKMVNEGLLIREEDVAPSGGREWHYQTVPR